MNRIGIECMKCADIEEESDRRAKVVAAGWGKELIQFHAALEI